MLPDVIGRRNRLIHVYFDINLDILWTTVQGSLPSLSLCVFPCNLSACRVCRLSPQWF